MSGSRSSGAKERAASAEREAWLARRERGSRLGMRALLWVTRVLGRRGGRLLLRVVVLYFALFAPRARLASRQLYARLGRRADYWSAYRHLLCFAEVAYDRVFLVRGELEHFDFDREGTELLRASVAAGRGGILLGAHFGSFEAMRAVARDSSVPINILAYTENARMISAFLDEVSGGAAQIRVIEIDPGDRTYILEVKQRIEAGELVAVLGDRLGLNDRSITVEFLGAPARFPVGPYMMAAALRCPVFTVFGTFVGPRRYLLRCELFSKQLELPRAQRQEALEICVRRYAERLEHYVRLAPDNWFNFYDFWALEPSEE